MTPDIINGAFELCGGLFILNHCRVLWQDKAVKGVSVLSTVFFSLWGLWNLFYYPHLDQWWSFVGGLVIMGANMLWIGMMVFYMQRQRRRERWLELQAEGVDTPDRRPRGDFRLAIRPE